MKVTIHATPSIGWHLKRGAFLAEGLKRAGVEVEITPDRFRHDGLPVLLGTTCWRGIEADGGEFLLVDRCSFGDTEQFVSLVRNGHGRRGDHRVPDTVDASRWERHGVPIKAWRDSGDRVLLCGQTEPYSPHWHRLEDWYAGFRFLATHFRPHPDGSNPTSLPITESLDDVGRAITLNSSIAVACVIAGIPTECWDEASMAWPVAGRACDRDQWCHWLAWTQWSDEEIREGVPWAYLL